MEIDFHFGVTYVLGRLAGFAHDSALTVATAAQYVDDTVSEGTINFITGEKYSRISSSHEKWNPKIALSSPERNVWVPFHFLPSAEQSPTPSGERFYDTIICRPNSQVAKEMLNVCISKKNTPNALHRLGITAHVFADTWAHQGFAGMNHKINRASKIKLLNIELGTPVDQFKRTFAHLQRAYEAQGLHSLLSRIWFNFLSKSLSWIFPMGHGAVLHYPDWPFLKWSYVNGHGIKIQRDNVSDFLEAAEELYKFFSRYRDNERNTSMPQQDRELIKTMFSTLQNEDGEKRCLKWIDAVKSGKFSFGPADISYFPKGQKSWKFKALHTNARWDFPWEKFEYTPEFLTSDWKLFHDALQSHRLDMLHEVFPKFEVCVN